MSAENPTFGACILLFFRSSEILSIWHQHHGIEQFWRQLKSIVRLGEMQLWGRAGAYAGVCVKVLSYLLLSVSQAEGLITVSYSENSGGSSPVSVKQPALIPCFHRAPGYCEF